MQVKWFKPEDRLPPDNRQVLCWWAPTKPYWPQGIYGVACYQDSGLWHAPEDDEDDFSTPALWTLMPPLPVEHRPAVSEEVSQ